MGMQRPKKGHEKSPLDALWTKYLKSSNTEARDELIVHYLYLVKSVVGRLSAALPSYVKLDDLYSYGVTGLIKAVERFDITKKTKFESYAILLIKGAIIDELRKLDWIPRSVHQKANQIAAAQSELKEQLGRDPHDSELAAHLGVTEEQLHELLERVRPFVLIPLNAETSFGEEERLPLSERIADTKACQSDEVAYRHEFKVFIEKALADLTEQERKVLILYYYEELMLKEIGNILSLSESRVSQIHTKALLKLRHKLKGVAGEFVSAF